MRDKPKKILKYILLVFLGLLLGINVYLLSARYIVGNQMPMPFGVGAAVVQSGSMEPTFYKGDLIFVKEQDEYDVGDIVVYQSDGFLVVHRIIDIQGDVITTQGDANNAPDEPFNESSIMGSVVFKISYVGYAIDFLKTPIGVFVIIGCTVLLLELSYRSEKRSAAVEEKNIDKLKEEIEQIKEELDKKQ